MQCANNLKQIGLAVHNYHDSYGYLPTHGNSGGIRRLNGSPTTPTSADPTRTEVGANAFQTAGVFFQILPFIEQNAVYGSTSNNPGPIKIYYCPARRGPIARSGGNGQGLNDYAVPIWTNVAGGGGSTAGCWGFWSDGSSGADNVNYPYYTNCVFVRGGIATGGVRAGFPPGTLLGITDGTSNTIMLSEKFVDPTRYNPTEPDPANTPWGAIGWTDNGFTAGWASWVTSRCAIHSPLRDRPYTTIAWWQYFGSAHPAGVNCLMADGSVLHYRYSGRNPDPVWQLLVRKADGFVVDLDGF
jgi:prepilin-type processing-associated H-X9-DG protein